MVVRCLYKKITPCTVSSILYTYTVRTQQRLYGDMNRIPEKFRNIGCKVKKNQCFTDYVSYLSTQYFVIFLEYGSCPVKPLLSYNSVELE
jgi:hypothetical protein